MVSRGRTARLWLLMPAAGGSLQRKKTAPTLDSACPGQEPARESGDFHGRMRVPTRHGNECSILSRTRAQQPEPAGEFVPVIDERTEGLTCMRINIEEHAQGFLEHLGESDDADVSTYLAAHQIDIQAGSMLVDYLVDRGWAKDHSTFGEVDCALTGSGLAVAQRLRTERRSPAHRLSNLRARMLTWLEHNRGTQDWSDFAASEAARFGDADFTWAEIEREAAYLYGHRLITAATIDQAEDGTISPAISAEGRDCLIHFEGDVNQYLNRSARPSAQHTTHNTTTITMADSVGNITNASSHVMQNAISGLDTTKVLEFAGAVRQTLPVLGLDDDAQRTVDGQAEELHNEANSAAPNRGKMRQLLDGILEALGSAGATVAQKMVLAAGNEAIQAING